MAQTVIQTWDLTTVDGRPYTLAVTDASRTYLKWGAADPIEIDPNALNGALDQAVALVADLARQICPATKLIAADTLTCDWAPGHVQNFHHDPRGVYWTFS